MSEKILVPIDVQTFVRLADYMKLAHIENIGQAIELLLRLEVTEEHGCIVSQHKCDSCDNRVIVRYTKTSHLKVYECIRCKRTFSPTYFGEK